MNKEELEKQTMEWKNNYILKLEKRCSDYEMTISKMEKGTCDICKETEKDKRLEKIEKKNAELKELLKKWVELYKPKLEGYPITPIQEQTEQFLSEVEK